MAQIATKRLLLRQLKAGDQREVTRLLKNFEVLRWLARPPHPYTCDDARAFIEWSLAATRTDVALIRAIILADGGDFAGIVSIEPTDDGPELGYWLGQSYWGRGIMSEATRALTRQFFAKPVNNVLRSGYISGNEASAAIQRKLGFQIVGNSRRDCRPLGAPVWHVDTCLTRAQFETLKR